MACVFFPVTRLQKGRIFGQNGFAIRGKIVASYTILHLPSKCSIEIFLLSPNLPEVEANCGREIVLSKERAQVCTKHDRDKLSDYYLPWLNRRLEVVATATGLEEKHIESRNNEYFPYEFIFFSLLFEFGALLPLFARSLFCLGNQLNASIESTQFFAWPAWRAAKRGRLGPDPRLCHGGRRRRRILLLSPPRRRRGPAALRRHRQARQARARVRKIWRHGIFCDSTLLSTHFTLTCWSSVANRAFLL